MPQRIQRKRTKGWKMPPNTVSVTRPGVFGNPFTMAAAVEAGYVDNPDETLAALFLTDCFRDWMSASGTLDVRDWWQGLESDKRKAEIKRRLHELRGKDLACWCDLSKPCHADVLLEIANA